jgi:hypothetical protein
MRVLQLALLCFITIIIIIIIIITTTIIDFVIKLFLKCFLVFLS